MAENNRRTGFERGHGFRGPVVKPKNQKETLKRIWQYVKKQRLGLFLAITFVIASTLLNLVAPYMIGVIVDDFILKGDVGGTIRMAMILAVIYVFSFLFTLLESFVMVRVSLKTMQSLRFDLFKKMQTLPLKFFDSRAQGDLMSRMTNDIDNLNMALSQSVIQIVTSLLTFVGVAFAMFSLNWRLAIVTLVVIPLIVVTSKQIIKRSSVNYTARQRDLGKLNGYIEEMMTGSEVITLFGKEQATVQHFYSMNENLRQSAQRAEMTSGLLGPLNNFMNNIGLSLVIGAGALLAVGGYATIGVIAAFVTYGSQLFRPLNQMSNLLNTFQSAIAGAERVFEILDEKSELTDASGGLEVGQFKGQVAFDHVDFSYDGEKRILKNINFTAKPGETVALVGPTGSGKTTIINLLTRFYDVNKGTILLDGYPITDYKIGNVRKKVGVVLQDTYLFSGTIRENIRYGCLDATDEEVENAAKVAYAHDFIKYLPLQYDTEIVSGGMNLSQGQRQLIAIARAILEDADLLILDEATSNVDTRTEVDIQNGLHNLMKGRTSFVIAHRLKTIENADQILVIKDGEIVEKGNHRSLLAKNGFYSDLQKELVLQKI